MNNDAQFIRDQLRITCVDAMGLMTEHLEQALSARDQERFRAHLDGCEACAVYLDQLRLTVEIIGTVGDHDVYRVDDTTMDRLVDIYRSSHQRE